MVYAISSRISKYLSVKHQKSYEVVNFGMQILVNMILTIILAFTTAFIFGFAKELLIVSISFALLRQFSGGYHLKSSDLCVIISSSTLILITMLHTYTTEYSILMNIISLLFMIIFAPITNKFKFKTSPRTYTKFKVVTIIIILINLFIVKSPLIDFTFFIVSLLMVPSVIQNKRKFIKRKEE